MAGMRAARSTARSTSCDVEVGEFVIRIWIAIYFGVLVWSGIDPKDQFTWFLEVAPAILGGIVLALTYKSFRLTNLVYGLILIHCIILMIGGHYTYAEVPLFDYFKDVFGSSRNNYDKVGHFAQGFIPAMVAREIILRKEVINGAAWQFFFIISFCLGFSAFYELIEWWVALATGEGAEAFLGTQGYIWDTQSDMALALAGAMTALLTLSKYHNQQILKISAQNKAG
jgi:putative membrane protein